ncbi:MAG: FAD-dependent oxidoreductase [Bacteroidetes bacterium]|nr:FAD-dependent oxidoreductase [Bacteroidota bacterium]
MERLAIIGTGIAGMGAAYHLKDHYDLTLFEKNNYVGGHTNTIKIDEDGANVFVDTGFMVFNKITYPNLTRLFEELNVEIKKTDMSFSVQHVPSKLEYNGSGISGLFSQRKNILNPSFIKMIIQINRFNQECLEVLDTDKFAGYTIQEYIDEKGYGNDFLMKYLVPMSSAVWSTPPDKMLHFPASTLVRFFYNHGFLGLDTQHQWYTVVNGSQAYREKLIDSFRDKISVGNGVKTVRRENGKIIVVTDDGSQHEFDKVVFASHADETLNMLSDANELENRLLSPFKYELNRATLHTDITVMPKLRRVWSSWNYRIEKKEEELKSSTIYYMNMLQQVSEKRDYFVSINDPGSIDERKIIKDILYHHPLFSVDTIEAQKELSKLNEQSNNTYFCGSYFKYGFHEDAYTSGLNLSKHLIAEKSHELTLV